MKYFVVLYLLSGHIFSPPVYSSELTLPKLMQALSQKNMVFAKFTEEKHDSFLDVPIKYQGHLKFNAPDYLEKTTTRPSFVSFVVKGEAVTVQHKQKESKTLSLNDYPFIKAFTESYRAILTGNSESLMKYHKVELQGELDGWSMELSPIDKGLRKVVKQMEFKGENNRITEIHTWFRNGDNSVMYIATESIDG